MEDLLNKLTIQMPKLTLFLFIVFLTSCEISINKDHVKEGNTFLRQGDVLNALTEFDDALFIDKKNTDAIRGKYFCYMQIGQLEKAQEQANKFIDLRPNDAAGFSDRGLALLANKNYNKALDDFNKAISLDSSYPTIAYFNKGQALLALNRCLEAIKCFDTVIQVDQSDSRAFYKRGLCFENIGNKDSACQSYNMAKILGDKDGIEAYNKNCR